MEGCTMNLRVSIFLLIAMLVVGCGSGGSSDNSSGSTSEGSIEKPLSNIDTSRKFIIPTADIIVDGDDSDWQNVDICIQNISSKGENISELTGSPDPDYIKIATDSQNTTLFILIKLNFGMYELFRDPIIRRGISLVFLNKQSYEEGPDGVDPCSTFYVGIFRSWLEEDPVWVIHFGQYNTCENRIDRYADMIVEDYLIECSCDISDLLYCDEFVLYGREGIAEGGVEKYLDLFRYNGVVCF